MDKSLNKFISETGFCSRRAADEFIEQGRVTINGKTARKGNRVHAEDKVLVDGEPLKKKDPVIYLALNKPPGITCTTDLRDKDNIIRFVNHKQRIFPVGRLDKPSEGLIFLTNDGDIVNKILRAGNSHEKEYVVTTDRPVTPEFINRMAGGVRILGTVTRKCDVRQEGKNRFRIILKQGLNRQIRRMCEVLGYHVVTLKRVRIMHIRLDKLPIGKWRYFTSEEIDAMEKLLAQSSKTAPAKSNQEAGQ
jgi:23S rRNA pseudouridine2604 synthase